MAAGKAAIACFLVVILSTLGGSLATSRKHRPAAEYHPVKYSIDWTYGDQTMKWPKGKKFKAGDIIVFHYDPVVHNVAVVNAAAYNTCLLPAGLKIYTSGNDQIKLKRGRNYFACEKPNHCGSGMRFAVTAD